MSNPINLHGLGGAAGVHHLTDMTEEKKQAQRRLDLFATMTMIASGFVSHPQYNTLVFTRDVEKFIEEIKDEFREINGFIVDRFEFANVLTEERYSKSEARVILIEFGFGCADYFYKHGHFMAYLLLQTLFDDVFQKHYPRHHPRDCEGGKHQFRESGYRKGECLWCPAVKK